MLSNLLHDVRYALHGFASRPMFAAVVVLTLAVAIGVNVAVFSLFDRIMLRELNVANPRELVNLAVPESESPGNRTCNEQGRCEQTFSYPMFRDLEAAGDGLVDLAASRIIVANFARDGSTSMGSAVLVSGSYFSALGVGPELGRVLGEQDVDAQPAASAVLSYDYWQTAYAAAPDVLGKTVVVAGKPLTIVGVAPRGFVGATPTARPRVFAPLTLEWFPERLPVPLVEDRLFYYTYVFGRLRAGASLEQAQDALNATYRAIRSDVEAPLVVALAAESGGRRFDVEAFVRTSLTLEPGSHGQTQAAYWARTPLAVFFAATATIFLIGCLNVANLMFARGAARVGEIAVRASLGAARSRLIGLLSVEALLLAGIAALASLPIAFGVLRAMELLQPPNLSSSGVDVDLRAAAAAFGIAAVSTLLFALLPTLRLVATDPVRAMQGSSARSFGGKNLGRFRFALATSQIALSMLLLVLAALFTQSIANIARVDLGLRTESVVTFQVAPYLNGYSQARQAQTFEEIERELKTEPGITHVAYSRIRVLSGSEWGSSVGVEGDERAGEMDDVNVNLVSLDFFGTLEIPLLRGRLFTDADSADQPLVAIVNESFAKRFGLGDDPVGRRLGREKPGQFEYEIVGLVRDAAYSSVKEQFPAQLFLARRQNPRLGDAHTFYVRGELPPEAILAAVPRIVARVDANLPVMEPRTLDSVMASSLRIDWLLLTLSGTLAVVATLLAALGLYGVLAFMVVQRTREIGLRLALGAEPDGVRRMVMTHVAWMAGIGLPVGIVAALLIGNVAASQLFGLTPADPLAVIAAAVVLAVSVMAASYLPARRASRIDPGVALRAE